MPSIKQDSVLNEYTFSQQEEINAKILSPLQIAWIQNKYAIAFKEKAAQIVPSDITLDRDYLLKLGELEGRLSAYQEFFIEHQEALKQLENPDFKDALQQTGNQDIAGLAARAANQVNQS